MDGSKFNNTPEPLSDEVKFMLAKPILHLAIDGWATDTNTPSQGIPALPNRKAFLPVFILLLHQPDWRDEIRRFSLISYKFATPHIRESLSRMCNCPDLHSGLVMALARLAA